jgi:hypothetical protein
VTDGSAILYSDAGTALIHLNLLSQTLARRRFSNPALPADGSLLVGSVYQSFLFPDCGCGAEEVLSGSLLDDATRKLKALKWGCPPQRGIISVKAATELVGQPVRLGRSSVVTQRLPAFCARLWAQAGMRAISSKLPNRAGADTDTLARKGNSL